MIEQIQNGSIENWQWKKIIHKMYDIQDVAILTEKFMESIEFRKQRKENQGGQVASPNNVAAAYQMTIGNSKFQQRKISRDEEIKQKTRKEEVKLMYAEFLKIILDF